MELSEIALIRKIRTVLKEKHNRYIGVLKNTGRWGSKMILTYTGVNDHSHTRDLPGWLISYVKWLSFEVWVLWCLVEVH